MQRARIAGQRGVTLVEMLVAVALIALVSGLAAPSFASLMRTSTRTATLNDLLHSMYFARSEAIKRGAVVSVCRSRDGTTCANSLPDWNSGWIVFVNLDRDQPATTDPGEPVIYRHEALGRGRLTSNRVSFSYRPYLQADVNGTLVYCPTPGSKEARAVIVSHTGRPRISSKDASGKSLKC